MIIMKCDINRLKKTFVYTSVIIYAVFSFLKENLNLNLGYYELFIVGYVGFLIRTSISIDRETVKESLQVLSPKFKRKMSEFFDVVSTGQTMRLNNQPNEPFSNLTPITTPANQDEEIKSENSFTIQINYNNDNDNNIEELKINDSIQNFINDIIEIDEKNKKEDTKINIPPLDIKN